MTAQRKASLALPLLVGLWGCAAQARKCLETPVSSKVRAAAVDTCEEALRDDMDRRDLFHRLVNLLRVRQRHDDVVKWSHRVLEHDKERADALFYLAHGLRKIGDLEGALRKYKAYANRNRDDPDPYFGIALCHQALGNTRGAIDAFQLYVSKERRQTQQQWVQLARTRIAALQGAPGRSTADRSDGPGPRSAGGGVGSLPGPAAAQPSPAAAAPSPVSAAALPAHAKPPAAPASALDCSAHEHAFKADPFNTDAYDKFGACALAAGRPDDVVRAMRIATRDNPDFVRGLLHMGRAFQAKGMPDRARGYFSKACNAGVPEACRQ